MFLHILMLLMLLESCTPVTEQNTTTPLHGIRNEIPFDNSSLTETTYDLPTDILLTTPEGENEDSSSTSDPRAPFGVTNSPSEEEEVALNEDDPSYEGLISGMKIHHCHCPGGEILTRSGCTSFSTSVRILDSTKFSPRTIPTSLLEGYVADLNCEVGKVPMIFPNGSFFLLPGGEVVIPSFGYYYDIDHYCVSHVDHRDGGMQTENRDEKLNRQIVGAMDVSIEEKHVSWKAKVCIKHPIHRCCDGISKSATSETHNGLKDSEHETDCSTQRNSLGKNDTNLFFSIDSDTLSSGRTESSRPIVMFGSNSIEWDYDRALPLHLNCPLGNYVVEQHMVNNKNINLSYSREGSMLSWSLPGNIYIDFRNDEFCLDRKGEEGNYKYFAKFCHYEGEQNSSLRNFQSPPYVRKCCSENTIYEVEKQSCEAATNQQMWIENIYKNDETSHDPLEYDEYNTDLARIPLMWGFPSCSWHDINISAEDWKLLPDGSVMVRDDTVDPSLFCFETFVSSKSSVQTLVLCDLADPFAGACSWATALLVPLMGVSCAFMALTLLIFLSVSDLTDRVSSRCLVSEIIALLVSFLLLIVAHTWQTIYGTVYCVLLGTLSHAATLASFFWLNAICIEVWITIRRINPEPRIQGHRRFAAYCCWGWGAPAAIALLGALADALPIHHGLLRPQTATACFPNKDNRSAHWAYVYAPMAALLCVNLALFVHLSVTIVRTTRQAARMRARAPSHDTSHYWNKMKTYLKLFLVMGVSWTAEVLSFQFKSCGVWIFTDSFNALRGVFIFFIFVFKAEVLEKVRKNAKDRWSNITGRASQILTAVRGHQDLHSRTNSKGGAQVTLSVLAPAATPGSPRPNGTPATTPTTFVSGPPEFPTVTPYSKYNANGVKPIHPIHQPAVFIVDEQSGLPSDQTTENHQQEEGLVPNHRSPSMTMFLLREQPQSASSRGGSFRGSSCRVAPISSKPSSGLVTLRCPLSEHSPGSSVTSKLLQSRSSPSLQSLNSSALDPWNTGGKGEAYVQRPLSVYSRHRRGDEL